MLCCSSLHSSALKSYIPEYNHRKQSNLTNSGEQLTDKVVRAFIFPWFDFCKLNKTSGHLIGKLTHALATAKLTPQHLEYPYMELYTITNSSLTAVSTPVLGAFKFDIQAQKSI